MMMRLSVLLLISSLGVVVRGQDQTCGADTFLDSQTNECLCNSNLPEDTNTIYLAGIFDTTAYDWASDIFEVTVKLINDRWWSNVLMDPEERLEYSLANSKCDETEAARAYWNARTENGNKPMHGLVGARCSGASVSLARISGLEGVPHVSPVSNSAKLSDDAMFPFFSRLLAPNDERGEVGALIALLRTFEWERITILATDTQFAKDMVTEFRKNWVGDHQDDSGDWFGQVAYSDTIRITTDGAVDENSVRQALGGVPVDDPTNNSRIILLVAHSQHAFKILEMATQSNFQPDSVWVGPSSWVGRSDASNDFAWLPQTPGYLGVSPFRNRDEHNQNFLVELQAWQQSQGKPVLEELPVFAAETVDAIVALTMAISASPDRRDGAAIVQQLRQLVFDGVSGRVQFTQLGDRKNPQYSVINAQPGSTNNDIPWTEVGSTGTEIGSVELPIGVCFAKAGCGLEDAPDDSYPVPKDKPSWWIIALILVFALLFIGVTFKYWRSRRRKHILKAELETFRKTVVGMRAAECDYIPKIVKKGSSTGDVEEAIVLSGVIPVVTAQETVQWCWKETDQYMNEHIANDICGDPVDCWIKYNKDTIEELEQAFQANKKQHTPIQGYVVIFGKMEQTKVATGFTRAVCRIVDEFKNDGDDDKQKEVDLGKVRMGDVLPDELTGEPQMVLVQGDIIKISKERSDGWAFGTKLHHADEAVTRQLVEVCTGAAGGGVENDDVEVSVFTDTGWFQLETTRIPSTEDLAALQKNVGHAGALDPPPHWDQINDKTVVQQHELRDGDLERDAVVKSFMSTLKYPTFHQKVKVIKVERIQNLAMWQSYVVKRQTICYRETGHNDDVDIHRRALERFERSWLWHGSNTEVMDKILQQGFNRSFCGKNATAYGKASTLPGVYFARDASYSADPLYSVPDGKGNQVVMACRVAVGEYCRGKHDALTPDVRDVASQSLYDTTAGLLYNDRMSNPSIFVTYHDAQAYPEYLITFRAT